MVKRCGHNLASGNRYNFGNLQFRIKQKRVEVKDLQMKVHSMLDNLALEETRKQLVELTQKKKSYRGKGPSACGLKKEIGIQHISMLWLQQEREITEFKALWLKT